MDAVGFFMNVVEATISYVLLCGYICSLRAESLVRVRGKFLAVKPPSRQLA